MPGRLVGKVAVVTGGANGLGLAYARALAAEGANVSIYDVADSASAVAELTATGVQAIGMRGDVTDVSAVGTLMRSTEATFGKIDILVNNAGLMGGTTKPFMEISSEEWDRLITVNTRGPFECCKAVVPIMRKQKYGKIINISSGMVFKGSPNLLHYVASKGAVIAMTRSMARELGVDNIAVNCIAPGFVLTGGTKGLATSPAHMALAMESRSFKREQTPEDLVGAMLFFATSDSDFVTGQTIVVDGGSAMH